MEAWSTYMGTPSPVCKPWVNTKCSYVDSKGNVHTFTIDAHGNTITSVIMRGDHWRQHHDSLKHVILHLANWSFFPVTCEVYDMFSLYIKNAEKSKNLTVKQKQAIVPDFHMGKDNTLADVKTASCCKTHYHPARFRNGIRHDAVRVRQQKVHGDYKAKANKADEEFNNFTGPRHTGPVATRLSSFGRIKGLVCGAFGEGSSDLHDLCEQMASSSVGRSSCELGARTTDEAKSRAKRHIYRTIGVEMMRGIAALRTHRLSMTISENEGDRQAAARRIWARTSWDTNNRIYHEKHNFGSKSHVRPW